MHRCLLRRSLGVGELPASALGRVVAAAQQTGSYSQARDLPPITSLGVGESQSRRVQSRQDCSWASNSRRAQERPRPARAAADPREQSVVLWHAGRVRLDCVMVEGVAPYVLVDSAESLVRPLAAAEGQEEGEQGEGDEVRRSYVDDSSECGESRGHHEDRRAGCRGADGRQPLRAQARCRDECGYGDRVQRRYAGASHYEADRHDDG